MPYAVQKRGEKWVTVNTDTHEVKGTHDSKEKAEKQRRLLEMVKHGGKPRNAEEGAVIVSAEELLRKGWDESHSEG